MKKIFLALLTFAIGLTALSAQTKYLVNTFTPIDSYCYTAYKYAGSSSKQIYMSGGLKWYGGFTISHTVGPYRPGYVTFKLGGKYDKLMFVLGHEQYGSGSSTEANVVTVNIDGRKVIDKVIYPYSIPERITIDVKGVDEITFKLVTGEGYIAVGEATLWTAGQVPSETGNLITKQATAIELVKVLKPYYQHVFQCISPTDTKTSVKINGQEYSYGLFANMHEPLVGEDPGWTYFNLRKQYSKLSFIIGPCDNTSGSAGKIWFTVKSDGKIIYELETSHEDIAQEVTLDITGCERLSFHSELESTSTSIALVDIMVYPKGEQVQDDGGFDATIDPRLKNLPDVCKLISNIPPYAAGAQTKKQIYDGSSDHITFSMGGVRFSEGIILFEKEWLLNDNTSAYAVFDLGKEFDYVSFTAGYLGKSGAMNNDVLRVYADDVIVLETPLMATYPNQEYVVPVKRCRKLRFENKGSSTLDVAAYGVADIVVYRGNAVENDLFVHTKPECPYTVDLIDLGAPYIHYVSPMKDAEDKIFYDGTTQRKYFDLNGKHINKGFMLQTSVHFSLDHGVLSGTDGAAAATVGGAAVGSAFVAGGAAVGGAVVGSTLIGAAAFLMLAAGGEAVENSCAAFNTYGEYNSVTFTVACYNPYNRPDDYKETLLIGADQIVMAEVTVYETMEPQTITVPLNGCEQLMFWLANTGDWSGQYIFYDIKLSKEYLEKDIPKAARLSQAIVTQPITSHKAVESVWERPKSSNQNNIDKFISGISTAYNEVEDLIDKTDPQYKIYTYYLETNAGQVCKAVSLKQVKTA
ncbi:MAG: NPCBM/NEW2 domain-containing protein, partial [Bacteroidales bacterium]|nr:NPCBM/NEW2 domain-containing protein [Bacteroidales bacterium]